MESYKQPDPAALEKSYKSCIEVTKARAANFHFAFKVLPNERYRGICALYAFSRIADDISDDEPNPEIALVKSRAWRDSFDQALAGNSDSHPILAAVADTMMKFKIPPVYMHELITGTEMDAQQKRYETWKDSYLYCYRVASVIGMMTIHVFGFTDPKAILLAEQTGIAFQMTNILRDLVEDGTRDRIYLPLEDLRAHEIPESELLAARNSPLLRKLVKFELERTKAYYSGCDELIPMIVPESRKAMAGLIAIYRRLLDEIERREYDVFSKRVSLSTVEKLKLASSFLLG